MAKTRRYEKACKSLTKMILQNIFLLINELIENNDIMNKE